MNDREPRRYFHRNRDTTTVGDVPLGVEIERLLPVLLPQQVGPARLRLRATRLSGPLFVPSKTKLADAAHGRRRTYEIELVRRDGFDEPLLVHAVEIGKVLPSMWSTNVRSASLTEYVPKLAKVPL